MKTMKKSELVFTLLTKYCEEEKAMLFWYHAWKSHSECSTLNYESIYREHCERYFVLQDVLIDYGYTLRELLAASSYEGSLYDYVK